MVKNTPLVLVVEDDKHIRRFLRAALEAENYRVLEAATGGQGLSDAASHHPDLVVLDLGLPDMDGVELVRALREWSALPVMVLSARHQETEKIKALDAGADDYVTKPFATGELLARLRVALRHARAKAQGQNDPHFAVAGLVVDLHQRRVRVAGQEVHLTPIEYRLLTVLIQHAGKVLTHRFLLGAVWGPNHQEDAPYLRIYMGHLRHKLEQDPSRPRFLLTEIGVGYRLAAE